jgi:hypothetical protein
MGNRRAQGMQRAKSGLIRGNPVQTPVLWHAGSSWGLVRHQTTDAVQPLFFLNWWLCLNHRQCLVIVFRLLGKSEGY